MHSQEEYNYYGQGQEKRSPSLEPEIEETRAPLPQIIRKEGSSSYLVQVPHNSGYCMPISVCDGIIEVELQRRQIGRIHASCGKCGNSVVVNSVGALQIELGVWDNK